MKRDAGYKPQESLDPFRPIDNSPSDGHFTRVSLLFYNLWYYYSTFYPLVNIFF